VIGAVLGVGIVKGISTVSGRMLVNIVIAWVLTPAISGFFATALDFIIHLQYVPNP
jgi:phosphate/sulfate permease